MAKWLERQQGGPKPRDEPSQVPPMHPSNYGFQKLSNAARGHQCFVKNIKVNHISHSPTKKSKWWTTVSPYITRGHQSSSPKSNGIWWNQNCKFALMHWSQNVRPPTKSIDTIRTKNSLSMRSVCKKLHHVRTRNCIHARYKKHEVEINIYLFFPALHFRSLWPLHNDHNQT